MNYWLSQSPPNQGQYHSQLQFQRQQLQQSQPQEGDNTNMNYPQQQMPNDPYTSNETDRPFLPQTSFPQQPKLQQQQQQQQQHQYPLPIQAGYPYQYQYTSYQSPYKYYQPQQSFSSSPIPNTLFNGSTTNPSSTIPHYVLNRPSNDDLENPSHLPFLQQMNADSSDQLQSKNINSNNPYPNTLPVIHNYNKNPTVNSLSVHKPGEYPYSQPPAPSRYASIPNVGYTTQQTPQPQQGHYQYYVPQQQQPAQQAQQSGYQLYPISQSHSNLNAASQSSLTSHTPISMATSSSNEQPNTQFDQQKSQAYLPSIQSQQSLVTPLVAQKTPLRFPSTGATLNTDTNVNLTPTQPNIISVPITLNKLSDSKKPEMARTTTSTDDDENDKLHQQDPDQGYIHKCHLCDKSFKRKSWLKRHLLSHSPERHFSCPWCLSKHKRKDNLLQHMKLKHADNVLQELKLHHVDFNDDLENAVTTSNNNIKTLLYEGKLNKDEVKKVLNSLIDRHNQI